MPFLSSIISSQYTYSTSITMTSRLMVLTKMILKYFPFLFTQNTRNRSQS